MNHISNMSHGQKEDDETMRKVKDKVIDLDYVLTNELGQLGRFQLMYIFLVAFPIMSCGFISDYIFTSAAIPHRCRIPECGESNKSVPFQPQWITEAIPQTTADGANSAVISCGRYAPTQTGSNGTLDYCPLDLFNQSTTVQCDDFVYARDTSVVYEFDLGCQEWLRSLSGTLSSLGTLLVLPFIGYISDHFGRRTALLISIFNTALIGIIKAFSVNYTMFLALQLLQTTLGAGLYSTSYIFATELVGPKYRVFASATCSSMFATGEMILGIIAWIVQPWRYLILTLYMLVLFLLSYYWIFPESIRWLLAKKKYPEARRAIENMARINKKEINGKSMHALMNPPTITLTNKQRSLIKSIIRSRVLLRRVCTTSIWWMTTTFVYYGLSINSTSLSTTTYLNYILTVAIEIPGFYSAVLTLNKFARRPTLCAAFLFSGACNLAFIFTPAELPVLRLIIYLAGKFGISLVFTSLYLYTSELYPTEFRHSLLGFSSMIGRIGSICAPLTPILAAYWHGMPNAIFAILGFISGLMILTQPETLGCELPDTLEDAEVIGTPNS